MSNDICQCQVRVDTQGSMVLQNIGGVQWTCLSRIHIRFMAGSDNAGAEEAETDCKSEASLSYVMTLRPA